MVNNGQEEAGPLRWHSAEISPDSNDLKYCTLKDDSMSDYGGTKDPIRPYVGRVIRAQSGLKEELSAASGWWQTQLCSAWSANERIACCCFALVKPEEDGSFTVVDGDHSINK